MLPAYIASSKAFILVNKRGNEVTALIVAKPPNLKELVGKDESGTFLKFLCSKCINIFSFF